MDELKPCAHCGARGEGNDAYIACETAGCVEIARPDGRGAIAAWNRRADGWISVADRLPAEGDKALVYTKDNDIWIAYHRGGYWFDDDAGRCIGDLRYGPHYQPLPPPPARQRDTAAD